MTFMRKFLDMLNMDNWNHKENSIEETDNEEFLNSIAKLEYILSELTKRKQQPNKEDKKLSPYDKYYENLKKQRENNLSILYNDVKEYQLKPFDLNKLFLSDGYFKVIGLEGKNLEKAYKYLQQVHDILEPFKHLYINAEFPNKIGTNYSFFCHEEKLPISHLRLSPYTATMKKNKYPFWLWLSHCNDYGTEYVYMIYFNQSGEIGKCDLSLHGSNGARLSYETKIRRNERGLYVMRINKTLYIEPYGTKVLYHYEDDKNFQKNIEPKYNDTPTNKKIKQEYMSAYDLERYAIECNAYVIREERKENNND